jgi:hypothetical protein
MHFKGFSAEVAEKYSIQRQTRPTHQSDNYIFLQNPLLNLLFSLHFCIFKTRYFFHILKKCPDMASVAVAQPDIKITVHWHASLGAFLNGIMSNVSNRLESSRAQRLLVLLEELNLKYEIKTYKRNMDALAPEEMKNIHPLGKSPSVEIEIPGQAPFVLAESGAIFEYLCDHFGKRLIPPRVKPDLEGKIGAETEEFRRNRYFMHYAEGSLMSLLAIAAVMLSECTPRR